MSKTLITFFTLGLIGLSILFVREKKRVLQTEVTAWTTDHSADCAVVLTGGPHRVREGFDLLAQSRIKKLILSGVHPKATLREIFPQWPYYGLLDEENVILERRSQTTYGNIQQTVPLLEALFCKDVILITSRVHMYRAYRTFRGKLSLDYPIYQRAIVARSLEPSWEDLVPEVFSSIFYSLFAY